MSEFDVYRRNLPHWRQSGGTYFVTWRLLPGAPDLNDSERDIVAVAMTHFHQHRYYLHAFVVMNDHVHALATPMGDIALESVVQGWKSFTTQRMWKETGRRGEVWQSEYFDRIVRDDAEFLEKQAYIRDNPAKRWPELTHYRWVGLESEF